MLEQEKPSKMNFQQILSVFIPNMWATISFNNHIYTFDFFGYSKTHQKYYISGHTGWGYKVVLLEDNTVLFGDKVSA